MGSKESMSRDQGASSVLALGHRPRCQCEEGFEAFAGRGGCWKDTLDPDGSRRGSVCAKGAFKGTRSLQAGEGHMVLAVDLQGAWCRRRATSSHQPGAVGQARKGPSALQVLPCIPTGVCGWQHLDELKPNKSSSAGFAQREGGMLCPEAKPITGAGCAAAFRRLRHRL